MATVIQLYGFEHYAYDNLHDHDAVNGRSATKSTGIVSSVGFAGSDLVNSLELDAGANIGLLNEVVLNGYNWVVGAEFDSDPYVPDSALYPGSTFEDSYNTFAASFPGLTEEEYCDFVKVSGNVNVGPYQCNIQGPTADLLCAPLMSLCDGQVIIQLRTLTGTFADDYSVLTGTLLPNSRFTVLGPLLSDGGYILTGRYVVPGTPVFFEQSLTDLGSGQLEWVGYVNGTEVARVRSVTGATSGRIRAESRSYGTSTPITYFDNLYVKLGNDDSTLLGKLDIEERLPTNTNLVMVDYNTPNATGTTLAHPGTASTGFDTAALSGGPTPDITSIAIHHASGMYSGDPGDTTTWSSGSIAWANYVAGTDFDDNVRATGDPEIYSANNPTAFSNYSDLTLNRVDPTSPAGSQSYAIDGLLIGFAFTGSYPTTQVEPFAECTCSASGPSLVEGTRTPRRPDPAFRLRFGNYTGVINSLGTFLQTELANYTDEGTSGLRGGVLDANGQRIRNVADGTVATDVVNYGQLKTALGI